MNVRKSLSVLAIGLSLFLVSIEPIQANDSSSTSVVLTQTEISQKLETLPGWSIEDRQLTRTFEFKNFVQAIAFVDRLVEPAEKLAHHPDLFIAYNKVTVSLTTHDAGGLTQKDFDLARIASELFALSVSFR